MLSGLGTLSRNKAVGIRLAKGETLESIEKNSHEVAEGIPTILVLGQIIQENNLDMPIMYNLYRFVVNEISIKELQNVYTHLNVGQDEYEKTQI